MVTQALTEPVTRDAIFLVVTVNPGEESRAVVRVVFSVVAMA